MATVRAFSVCQSDGTDNAPTVYSYSVAPDLQDGSTLTPDGTPAEDAYRTGLSPAYCHGGAATADADASGYTTNLTADMLGAGLQVAVSTNANGVPTLLATDIIVAGGGYAEDDVVGLDGFPGTEVTISIA